MNDIHRKRIVDKRARLKRAHRRVRSRVKGTPERPRLCVHKSIKYLYAQVIDDVSGHTLVAASSLEGELRNELAGKTASKGAAKRVGTLIAERAKEAGVSQVVFDRGGYIYHGNLKELAEAAREAGLSF